MDPVSAILAGIQLANAAAPMIANLIISIRHHGGAETTVEATGGKIRVVIDETIAAAMKDNAEIVEWFKAKGITPPGGG